jgi:hypothetical protein
MRKVTDGRERAGRSTPSCGDTWAHGTRLLAIAKKRTWWGGASPCHSMGSETGHFSPPLLVLSRWWK